MRNRKIRRRDLLKSIPILASAIAMPSVVRSASAGQVFIRSTGGSLEEAKRKVLYEPFTAETGIAVQPVPITPARIVAMVRAQSVTLDVLSISEFGMIGLIKAGALEPIDTSRFSRTKLADLGSVGTHWVSETSYGTVLSYRTTAFKDSPPKSWADFWDTGRFPGRRMLQDPSFGAIDLEQALLADGVPLKDLYPLDIDRGFKKLGEIKGSIAKWWDSGAVSAQMLADGVADCGSIWDSRASTLIDGGAPIAIEWNQSMRNRQVVGVVNGAPNREGAYKLIDYILQHDLQAKMANEAKISPSNKRAFELIDPAVAPRLCTNPAYANIGFDNNAQWWADNGPKVVERFREFRL